MLDGQQGSSYLRSNADDSYDGDLTLNGMIFKDNSNTTRNLKIQGPSGNDIGISGFTSAGTHAFQLYGTNANTYGFLDGNWGNWDLQVTKNGGLTKRVSGSTATIWHSSNDGSNSGLDADLLDGVQGSSYLRSDQNDTTSGILTTQQVRWGTGAGTYSGNPRSAVIGYSGGNYGQIGYGWHPTSTSGTHTSQINDLQSRIDLYNGIIVYGSGTAQSVGSTVSWTTLLDCRTNSFQYKGNNIWHAGNDGSGSGLDADLLDGLQLHTGRNNQGNRVVRTDVNGYIQAGWINTTSGATTSTIDRIYASNDGYIRYVTKDTLGTQIGPHIKGIGSYTGDPGNNMLQYWQTSGNTTLNPTTDWYNAIRMGHGDPVTYYGITIAVKMTGTNVGDLYTRTLSNGTQQSWNRHWHNNNDGSGSGLDADTLDGLHASAFTEFNHFRSLGTTAFTGTNTTAGYISEMESDGAFDSYSSAFKTSWSYAGNFDISDAGSYGPTETAGMAHFCWTDNSSDTTRGNITVLAIAPNTGGSAGRTFIYNDQGSSYSPGWREIWTSRRMGAGTGLDADLLDGFHESTFMRKSANSGLDMNNNNITEINTLQIADPGPTEGLEWMNGNGWKIVECPDDMSSNSSGNLQFATGSTRRMTVRSDGKVQFSSNLMRTAHHTGHLEGSYNNIGANGYKSNPIYTIGSSYNPNDASLNNMYGIGYCRADQASFVSMGGASNWGMYVAADGDARIFLDGGNGHVVSSGEHYVEMELRLIPPIAL